MRIRRSVTAPLAGEMNPLLWLGTNSVIARERRASGSATGLWSQRESPSLWYIANTSRSGGCSSQSRTIDSSGSLSELRIFFTRKPVWTTSSTFAPAGKIFQRAKVARTPGISVQCTSLSAPSLWLCTCTISNSALDKRAIFSAWAKATRLVLEKSDGCKILIRGSPPVVVSATSTSLRRCLLRAAGDLRLTVSTGQDAATKCEYYQKRPL